MTTLNATGDVWDLSTDYDATFPMATDAMKFKIEGNFRQRERKLFVLLIHAAWEELSTKQTHQVRIKDVERLFAEAANVKSFEWLWGYLKNLAEIKVTFESDRLEGLFRLLAAVYIDKEAGLIHYQVPELLVSVLFAPRQFGRLRTHFIIGLKGKYSVALYQFLESKVNLRNPTFETALEDLKGWLGINGEYKQWIHFKSRVLEPAVQEINANPIAATFIVEATPIRARKQKVVAVRFQVTKTPARKTFEQSIKASQAKRLEAELYTFVPQFSEPWVIKTVRQHCFGWDHKVIERQFREKVVKDKIEVKYPQAAFVAYCKKIGKHSAY
jgi:hypothetical protein